MGNKLAKDFKEMKLGHGHMTAASAVRNAIVPDAVVLNAALTIAVQKDTKSKSIQFFDVATEKRLFVATFSKGESFGSVTRDSRGNVLFVTKAPDKATRVIFKPTEALSKEISSEGSSVDENDDDLSPIARVEIDFVASCITAFLSVKFKPKKSKCDGSAASGQSRESPSKESKGTTGTNGLSISASAAMAFDMERPTYIEVYKAVKIPTVKFGAVIVDMMGQVVGKAEQGKNPLPTVMVAPGADAAAVVALACMVNGEL